MNVLASFFLISLMFISNPWENSWDIFARVKFNPKFFKEFNEHFLVPTFDAEIKAYEGKQIILKGHYLPYDLSDKTAMVISKHPYSACFFCGGAGPESVAEVVFTSKRPKLMADQIVTVIGTL